MRIRSTLIVRALSALVASGCAMLYGDSHPAIQVRNNHELAYHGPLSFETELPDGTYELEAKAPGATGHGEVRSGLARMVVDLPARSALVLARSGEPGESRSAEGPLSIAPRTEGEVKAHGDGEVEREGERDGEGVGLGLDWDGAALGSLELGLVVIPGTDGQPDDATAAFEPLGIEWKERPDGTLQGTVVRDGFRIEASLVPYGGGWLDMHARLTQLEDRLRPAYVALVRRVSIASGIDSARIRFNGRVLDGADSPDTWERDFWYSRGVDWISWKAGALAMASMSGFVPVPTIERDSVWGQGSHFYVWERTRKSGNQLYLISEISGPNPKQARSRYMRVTPYAPVRKGDSLELTWRLAVGREPAEGWEESQLRVFAGYRSVDADSGVEAVELGVPSVEFGTSYFPYSTFAENFDYYRTPGLDRETWWPFSPDMWSRWRDFVPRMRTDLHIIRAMGFEWVRLHHLELLQGMDREEALAFLDFYMDEARKLGLRVLVDTEGPPEWVSLIASRYSDVVRRIEVENEVLIPGIGPGDVERWTALYNAARKADPEAQIFFTSAGNDGTFERLRTLGVPFDRVGLHAYKHGPEWKEALSSHVLGAAGYARSLGKFVTLGEFNWKGLTRLSPEERREEFVAVYEAMLRPRAIPEVFQFHFQETIGVNPSIGRSGVRHYETISLDRRPKPEALELMRLIRRYAAPDSPVRELPVTIREARLVDGHASVQFTMVNRTPRRLSIELDAQAFDGISPRVTSAREVSLDPGESAEGTIELQLGQGALPGSYHYFLRADYEDGVAYGWGIASNPGAPAFEAKPVLGELVEYPQGADIVESFGWSGPLAVAFGPEAPGLEMEMAYLVANTLQSATGLPVRLSTTADLPDSLLADGSLILVGTAESNPLIAATQRRSTGGQGVVRLRESGGGTQQLLLTGGTSKAVEAAATDFVLRYWKNARSSGIRITGMEKGAALGDTARVTDPDPP